MHHLMTLLLIIGLAAVAEETQRDVDFSVTVVDHLQRPIAGAVVMSPTNRRDELKIFRTDANGVVKLPSLNTPVCFLEVSAEGFRETLWQGKPNVAETIVMSPGISGRVLDDKEQPMIDAWLTSEPVVFGKTGLPEFPIRTVSDAGQDWSYGGGKFRLKSAHVASSLLQNDSESLLPLFVFERTHQFGQFHFLPLSDLDKLLEIKLQPLVHVQATYTFNSKKPPRSFRWILTDKEQRTLAEIRASVESNIYETSAALNCILPPGEYELHCVDMIPEHEPVVIPVKVDGDVRSVRIDKQDVEPGMISALSLSITEEPEAPLFIMDDIEAPEGNWGTICGRIIGDRATVSHRPQHRESVPIRNLARGIAQDIPDEDLKVNAKTGGVENVFVWMAKRPDSVHPDLIKPSADPLWFGQKNLRFIPRALVAQTGQTVAIANADSVVSNVHTYPLKNQPVSFRIAPSVIGAQAEKLKLTNAESLPLKVCSDIYPWMSAYWLVVDHPYATKTNSEGDFVIRNLPPGEHQFKVWHERKGYLQRKFLIRVEAGKVTQVEFEPVSIVQP